MPPDGPRPPGPRPPEPSPPEPSPPEPSHDGPHGGPHGDARSRPQWGEGVVAAARRPHSLKVNLGTHVVSDRPDVMMVTTLGSCVSACIHDPVAGIGGMNHFLLPRVPESERNVVDHAERYGGVAMERLINDLLSAGARRNRLVAKVFGGAHVIESSYDIGGSNGRFVLDYIENEGLTLAARDLGGTAARRVHYFPHSGKVMRRLLRTQAMKDTVSREMRFRDTLRAEPGAEGDIELFGDQ